MYKVIFEGFDTLKQASAFADWYAGSGEQYSECWLEEHTDLSFAYVYDVTYSGNNVTVELDIAYKNETED